MTNEVKSAPQEMQIFKFAPFHSFVSPTFWHKFSEIKLELDRLSDAPKHIHGFYTNREAKACLLEVDYSSFTRLFVITRSDFTPPKYCHAAQGTLYNKNTIEDFKGCDKNAFLVSEGRKLLNDFQSGQVLEDPKCLARFAILSFADLKCHSFYYWFSFPCPLEPTLQTKHTKPKKLCDIPELNNLLNILQETPHDKQQPFFIFKLNSSKLYTLKECIQLQYPSENFLNENIENYYFCFADANNDDNPSWLMRTFAAFLFYSSPSLIGRAVNFLGLRFNKQMQPDKSLIWEVIQTDYVNFDVNEAPLVRFVGWEPNRIRNKMAPNMVSMRDSMDPARLAETSIDLNLKLMKWRLLPELDLEKISSTKCLLFGAGTLGCAVARNLLSWGFKYITLVDNGKVTFANPLRQNLYTHEDAVAGNVMKATMAATRLSELNPNAITLGYVLEIPMPGHTISDSQKSQVTEELNIIESLVKQHDVLFLLTDSRESRWLPTVLGTTFNKIVINAALGFDSYLVMRHGAGKSPVAGEGDDINAAPVDVGDLKCISGSNLGCYFCNDVTAPGNSLKDRTLDQQCTVTRPGVSNIAASYAVELLVSVLQHPQREHVPAYYCASGKSETKTPEGILGIIPHSIRGMLFNYENILPASARFTQCIGCSELVISEYRRDGHGFLFKAFESAKYLEDLTGISDYEDLNNEIIDFDDSDLETE